MTKKENKLKGESNDELKKKLIILQAEMQTSKFKAQGAKSKNVKEAVVLRKGIARVLTEMNISNKKN